LNTAGSASMPGTARTRSTSSGPCLVMSSEPISLCGHFLPFRIRLTAKPPRP
jgi:hypothetical protein